MKKTSLGRIIPWSIAVCFNASFPSQAGQNVDSNSKCGGRGCATAVDQGYRCDRQALSAGRDVHSASRGRCYGRLLMKTGHTEATQQKKRKGHP